MFANIYTPDVGWGTPEMTGPVAGGWHPFGGFVSAGAEGEFFVIWEQADTYDYPHNWSVWSMRWLDGIGWQEPTMLNSGLATDGMMWTDISANGEGQAIATWTDGDEVATDVMACIYTPGVGWGFAEAVGGEGDERSWYSQVEVAPNGDAVLIFRQDSGTEAYLWAREYYQEERPDLAVASPLDGSVLDQPMVVVTGTTDPGVTLTVNGIVTTVEADGSFAATVALVDGVNPITVIATIEGGGVRGVTVAVEYIDPVPALLEEIARLSELLNTTSEEIAALEAELAQSEADYDDVVAELATLSDEVAALQAELAQWETDYDDVSADLVEIAEQLNESQELATDLQEQVDDLDATVADREDDASAARMLEYALFVVIAALAIAVMLLLVQNSKLRKGRGPQGPG